MEKEEKIISEEEFISLTVQMLKKSRKPFDFEVFSWKYKQDKAAIDQDFKDILTKKAETFDEIQELLSKMPEMSCSVNAMSLIEKDKHLSGMYADFMLKFCDGRLPIGVELMSIYLMGDGVIQAFSARDYEWSDRAKRQMERFHPELYKRLFCTVRSYSSWMD